MTNANRRQFLKDVLGKLAQAAGSIVLASAAAGAVSAQEPCAAPTDTPGEEVAARADKLAENELVSSEPSQRGFRNARFANGSGGGAFRNTAGFRNGGGGGGFHNGGFTNGGGGGFRNGGFANGGGGGGFRNSAGFRNY